MVFEQGVVFARMAIACVVCVAGMLFVRLVLRTRAGLHLRNRPPKAPFPWLAVHKNASSAVSLAHPRDYGAFEYVYPFATDSMDVCKCRPLSIVTIAETFLLFESEYDDAFAQRGLTRLRLALSVTSWHPSQSEMSSDQLDAVRILLNHLTK